MDQNLEKKCPNSTLFIPRSTDDLEPIVAKMKLENYEQPIRIWTDYERLNKTHFWSEAGQFWLVSNFVPNNFVFFAAES